MRPKVSISIHEASVERHGIDDELVAAMAAAARGVRESVERAAQAAVTIRANPLQTPLANERSLRAASFKFLEGALPRVDQTSRHAMETIKSLEEKVRAPLPPANIGDATLEQQIQNRLAQMDDTERSKALSQAVTEGDARVISAISRGPSWLTKVGEAERDLRIDQWRRRTFPQEVARIEKLRAAVTDLDKVARLAMKFAADLTNGAEIAEAEAKESSARAIATAS